MIVPRALSTPFASQGLKSSAVLLGLALGAAAFGFVGTGLGLAVIATANLLFFRNPARTPPAGEARIVAPADGRVVEVIDLEDPDGFVGPARRVAIFLSVFDVHVNRAPVSGKVRAVRRKGAAFRAAFRADASDLNVQSRLDVETPEGVRLAVVQITGLIARRIVSYPAEGADLVRGEPYGLICYGSRAEVWLPRTARVTVQPGDRVRAGESVLAELEAR